jgi:hypothetical protein
LFFPSSIVRAQTEGEAQTPPPETVVEPAADAAATEPTEEADPVAPPEEEGSALGAETASEAASSSELEQDADAPAVSSEPSATDEGAATAVEESASTTPPEFLTLDAASSTASSTEPVVDPPAEEPKEEPFVLQPAVSLHVSGSSISADIQLENLTCKSCGKVLPAAQAKAYYTAWYPNDGEIKEAGERIGEQAIEVSDVALWSARSISWSATDIAPGRYYFVVVVDPENAIGAYRMHRSEFAI